MIKTNLNKLLMELPATVKLVAVSKFHPFESIAEACGAGQRIFAESRAQELYSKVKALDSLRQGRIEKALAEGGDTESAKAYMADLQWHFIGHLQTNKLKMVLPYVSLVHSVDSVRLLDAIDSWGKANGKITDVLIECHISSDESKQGFSQEEFSAFLAEKKNRTHVRVRGVMGMATLTDDAETVRNDFSRLVRMSGMLRDTFGDGCDEISMGMSGDYQIAVEMGSTMVRVGSMIFGEREY